MIETNFNQAAVTKAFESLRANQYQVAETSARQRIQKLERLRRTLLQYRGELRAAMWQDFRKPAAEVDLTEIFVVTNEIKHAKAHLRRWMAPRPVDTPITLFGGKSWIQYEPKGICLILSPWNYPLMLALGPLVSAVAAGNTVILKPSEHTPATSAVMKKIVAEVFPENEVLLLEGGVGTATALLELPFNHILFTGSPQVGKIVMAAAAKHLASVTLELGGKSPVIVDETANLNSVVPRIVWGKFSNNGQLCIGGDYVLVHERVKEAFVQKMKTCIAEMYGQNASLSADYMRIVNAGHFQRVKSYLDDSAGKGAKVVHGGHSDAADNFIEPTLVTDVPPDSELMQQEIFGPVLPIVPYSDLQQAIDLIRSKEKPLALYIFSKNRRNIKRIVQSTRAGGTCINHNVVHFFNNDLPFGGSNNSGIGRCHGRFGFEAFSEPRGMYKQVLPSALDFLLPPYTPLKQKLVDLVLKWL